ncbi:hypothetical protein [Saccharopolyspora sp. NPDC002376]
MGPAGEDNWAGLADQFADGAYGTVKGRVRTYVMHQQLLEHLPAPQATAKVELEASRRDPYRRISRVFHLVGRKNPN